MREQTVRVGLGPRIVQAVVGVAAGAGYVLVSGLLGIQAEAARSGATVNLRNELTGITEPGTPIPQLAAAALIGVVVWFVVTAGQRREVRIARVLGFALASLALVAWALVVQESQTPGELPWAPGALGWVQVGGQYGGVHLLTLLTVASLWLPRRSSDSARSVAQTASQSSRTSQAPSSS